MDENDVKVERREWVYDGFNRVSRVYFRHRRFNGSWSRLIDREVFERKDAIAVLPYDPELDRIVLIEQFRVGAFVAGRPAWQLEPVAGLAESPGEDPTAIARKETVEEAGCTILALEPICRYLVSPGCGSELVTCYLGRIDSSNAGGIFGCGHEDEDIRAHALPFEEAACALAEGKFEFSLTIICLQWLVLNRERVLAKWLRRGAAR